MIEKIPYKPDNHEWTEAFNMLCGHCSSFPNCDIVDGMIEMKEGGDWPSGGWVHDAGAGISCLSYRSIVDEASQLSDSELKTHINNAAPMCEGCAARKGTEASVSHHTRIDFKAAVSKKVLFTCHKECNLGKPCGGWAAAISARLTEVAK